LYLESKLVYLPASQVRLISKDSNTLQTMRENLGGEDQQDTSQLKYLGTLDERYIYYNYLEVFSIPDLSDFSPECSQHLRDTYFRMKLAYLTAKRVESENSLKKYRDTNTKLVETLR
jgi:hypothetical protein